MCAFSIGSVFHKSAMGRPVYTGAGLQRNTCLWCSAAYTSTAYLHTSAKWERKVETTISSGQRRRVCAVGASRGAIIHIDCVVVIVICNFTDSGRRYVFSGGYATSTTIT